MPILKNIAGAVVGEVIGHKRGHGLLGAGIGLIATRIATKSLPGALFIGGAYVAKMLYDKRREKSQEEVLTVGKTHAPKHLRSKKALRQ